MIIGLAGGCTATLQDSPAAGACVDDCNRGHRSASPAAVAEDGSVVPELLEHAEQDQADRLRESHRNPPPRPQGKPFTAAVVGRDGLIHRVDIRRFDSHTETRLDGQLIPRERVRVHARGLVEILDEQGAPTLSFLLPRAQSSINLSASR